MRYTLTNRRVMIRRGLTARPTHEVQLSEIDDVRVVEGSQNSFYRAADLEILSKGQVLLRLAGVPEAESFRHAIINSFQAWHPVKAK